MATSNRSRPKQNFLASDFRDIRAARLAKLYIPDSSSRVKCSEVLQDILSEQAPNQISSRECGFIVRKCFPSVKRIHSNHVYYYSGIRRILTSDILDHHENEDVSQEIPKSLYIKRNELLQPRSEEPIYNFDNGVASNTEMRSFKGISVAVRSYNTDIASQAKAILSLPSHPCLPLLVGICCDFQPYLIVTKFYGFTRLRLMLSLHAVLKENDTRKFTTAHWLSILQDIAEGLLHMHTNGFCHGDLRPSNIILHKKWGMSKFLQPVFLNLDKARGIASTLNKDNSEATSKDLYMFGCLVESISCKVDPVVCDCFGEITKILSKVSYAKHFELIEDIIVCLHTIINDHDSTD